MKLSPIEEFKKIIVTTEHKKGMSTATAKIFSEIFCSTKEISIETLSKNTRYSLATISNNVKFLEQNGAINKIKKPGSKKIYVTAERDFMKILIKGMNTQHEITIRPVKQLLPKLIKKQKELIKETKQESKRELLKKELTIIEQQLKQVNLVEKLIDHIIDHIITHVTNKSK